MTLLTTPVIFDLDGTLVDPAGGITDGIASALKELGLPVPGQTVLDAMIGPKLSDALLSIAMVPAEQLDAVIRIYRQHYLATGIAQGKLYPGILEVLDSLAVAGRVIAVATQKPEGLARTVLEHHGIADQFLFIRGSVADESGPAGGPADKTAIIGAVLSDLGATHAVMIGDRAQDVVGAIANGLDCIGVSWGFASEGELREAGAVAVVEDTMALLRTVESMDLVQLAARSEVRNDGTV